jgi:hypothetical protein
MLTIRYLPWLFGTVSAVLLLVAQTGAEVAEANLCNFFKKAWPSLTSACIPNFEAWGIFALGAIFAVCAVFIVWDWATLRQAVRGKLRLLDVWVESNHGIAREGIILEVIKFGVIFDSISPDPITFEFTGAMEFEARISPHPVQPLRGEVHIGIPMPASCNAVYFDPPLRMPLGEWHLGRLEFQTRYGLGGRLRYRLDGRLRIGVMADYTVPGNLRVRWEFDQGRFIPIRRPKLEDVDPQT